MPMLSSFRPPQSVCLLAGALLACAEGPAVPHATVDGSPFPTSAQRPWAGPPNILLITVCSLRADALADGGGPLGWTSGAARSPWASPPTPTIDAFARSAVRFSRAWTNATFTAAAHASLLTGLLPAHAGLLDLGDAIRPGPPTLAEVLKLYGYATLTYLPVAHSEKPPAPRGGPGKAGKGGKMGPPPEPQRPEGCEGAPPPPDPLGNIPKTNPSTLHAGSGFERGVDRFVEGDSERCDPVAVEALPTDRPWFALFHLKEAHYPYGLRDQRPEELDPRLVNLVHDRPGPRDREAEAANLRGELATDPALRAQLWNSYAEAVQRADTHLASLLEALEEAGQLRDTLIVVAGDHGESLGDGDGIGHQSNFTPEVAHVPLLIRLPGGVGAGQTIDSDVTLADLGPTLISAAGAVVPAISDGEDLLPRIFGAPAAPRPVIVQGRSVRRDGSRIDRVWMSMGDSALRLTAPDPGISPLDGVGERFALRPDGWLLSPDPAAEALLRGEYAAKTRDGAGSSTGAPIDADTRARLRRDGYW